MKILLDTHVWLWSIASPSSLRDEARRLLADPTNELLFSAASAWEIAIKHRLGRLPLPDAPEVFVPQRLVRDGIMALPVRHDHALRVAALPDHHRDPFDRLLVAQAQIEDVPIMTADPQLGAYAVRILRAIA